jgi:LmbE family N-acetylglucosaminyl deacetylase
MRFPVFLAAVLGVLGPVAGIAAPVEPKQGAEMLKTDLMGVFAHPDDETGAAATLAAYAKARGMVVANVYCTRGEGGGNMVGTQAGAALGILREVELRNCLADLGVKHAFFLEREDFAYTESLLVTLEKWNHPAALERLVRLVRSLRPEVIVTMNPAPVPGQHGNHQAAGLLAIEAFEAAADPAMFPLQLSREGLKIWRPRKLYFGGEGPFAAKVDVSAKVSGGATAAETAAAAMGRHRSQGFGSHQGRRSFPRFQSWNLVESVVPFEPGETDLFRGLPVAAEAPPRVFAPGDLPAARDLAFRFIGRPATEAYGAIVNAARIGHVAVELPVDVPVVAGENAEVFFWMANSTARDEPATMRFKAPEGWVLHDEVRALFSARATNEGKVFISVPAAASADVEVSAVTTVGGASLPARARLHPVPKLRVPRVSAPLAAVADERDAGWAGLPSHFISHTNSWEGKASSDADCSAVFKVAHDGKSLFVEVRVRDDHLVSNIEPDDIKGHWRSDSIELCVDPDAGAENTMKSFKLGIFPFDTTGRVRAARDADANQGPVESTAPGVRLSSWRMSDGYGVRAVVPFDMLGVKPASGTRFGFNVLIYDGDKVDAKPGENINRSRLAWASRPGVQGRPEDWGRADLE